VVKRHNPERMHPQCDQQLVFKQFVCPWGLSAL
jgi:hypothetical protein